MTTTAPTTSTIPTADGDPERTEAGTPPAHRTPASIPRRIPLTRVIAVELRKSFDTRSGFWLLAGIGLSALLTTGAVIAWAPASEFSYSQFTLAIGVPMTVILPIIAVLSVTAEFSQRTGLTTFTLVPNRGRVLFAKALACGLVALAATAVAFTVGAVGNVAGAVMAGIDPVWNQDLTDVGYFALGNSLLLLVGFTMGALIRNSPEPSSATWSTRSLPPACSPSSRSIRPGSATHARGSTPSSTRTPSCTEPSPATVGPTWPSQPSSGWCSL
jgi:ABC-2 type transport system permease protein